MGWRNRPTFIDYCPKDVDYILFIDENGDSSIDNIKKCISKSLNIDDKDCFFTITGVIVKSENLKAITDAILTIKNKYWNNGYFNYKDAKKRVCFHSSEIRKEQGPFSRAVINREEYISDLSVFLDKVQATIISSTINKYEHCKKYVYPLHPYCLSLNFILERFAKYYLKSNNSKAIIILESRGKKEDKIILNHIKKVFDEGTSYVNTAYFKRIKGVYFNPKWQNSSNCLKSYYGLEIADLFSYPIYKYCKYGEKDQAFNVLEKKLYNYPDYTGCGIKIFPQK